MTMQEQIEATLAKLDALWPLYVKDDSPESFAKAIQILDLRLRALGIQQPVDGPA